ncbi:MAG: PRC-barrel domain-containing protein [Pseudomonadota bacterium]|nr:PRC-barrel domain-containing protein [Pseudomonadota bacterium]
MSMRYKLLAAASVIAVMSATPVLGQAQTQPQTQTRTQEPSGTLSRDVEKGWEKTKKAVSDTAQDVSTAAKDAYDDLKTWLAGTDDTTAVGTVSIDRRTTATGIIGQPVYNAQGERVAKVRDIILDHYGSAGMVVLGDGDFTGLGKTVAFDYSVISNRTADGDLIAPLTEDTIDDARNFSYDRDDASNTVRVIPADGYSVDDLLDAPLVNAQGETVGEVDDISFRGGKAEYLVVSFGKVLGIGGGKAALAWDNAKLIRRDNDKPAFQLSADQATRIENYRKNPPRK